MTSVPPQTDYKATLCLPQTDFPMRANLNQREPEVMARWTEQNLSGKIAQRPGTKGTFVLHDGPPYANGAIHVGHALNKVLKDIIVRYRTMDGYNSPYVPGWDCHGLPIELKVSGELGKKKRDMSVSEFRRHCDAYARKWIANQSTAFQRLGITGQWEKPYLTLDPAYEAAELRALQKMVEAGFVYKGLKPVFWCTSCQTALADAEVEYADHESPSIYVKFPVVAGQAGPLAGYANSNIIIWTTTPWTLPANLAVSLHPRFEYAILKKDDEHWIVASDMWSKFAEATGFDKLEKIGQMRGDELENLVLEHPVQPDRTSRVILGEHVTLEAGTGAVHTAPGHGMDDFIVGRKYGLEVLVPVDAAGKYTAEFGLMEGMPVREANGPIIRYLDEKNLLVFHAPYKHSYAHCWRCNNPIIYRATEQWFLKVDHEDLRKRTLDAISNSVKWIPGWGHDRIFNMMEARPDWCLSRQRVWGVPIPSVQCTGCKSSTLSPEVISDLQEKVKTRGTECWWDDPVESFLPEGFACPDCKGTSFQKETDILDVWFDSGVSHEAVLSSGVWPELSAPADLYLEGSDQHRGWFHTSLLTGMALSGQPPYKAVLTHGFVLDGKGEAMSKSKGNVIAPDTVIKQYGADILRLWVTSEDYRNDLKLSEEILTRVAEGYRRVRNTVRYLLGNLTDFNPETDSVAYPDLLEIDHWILNELYEFQAATLKAYENYEFHKIYHLATQFCVVQLSSVYLDITKDRMYCSGASSLERRAAQTAQRAVADSLLRVLAPVMPFTTDEAYHYLDTAVDSVHLLPFNTLSTDWRRPELAATWSDLLEVRGDVLRALEDARQVKKAIGQSLAARVELYSKDEKLTGLLKASEANLADLFITSQAAVVAESELRPGVISEVEGTRVLVRVFPAEGAKCERCWRIVPDTGADAEHRQLCKRCVDVMRRHYSHGI